MNSVLKIALIIVAFAGVAGISSFVIVSTLHPTPAQPTNIDSSQPFGWKYPTVKFPLVGPTSSEIAYSSIRDPGGIPQGLPIRLKIPIIGVDSAIEDALITSDGRMDVPSGSRNVAWFALGPNPGQTGSAVIGGHFGITNGVPFVFYALDKLVVGDKVYVVNDRGETLAFQVRSIQLFDRNADATTVFTSEDGFAHLNLITCEGIWNQVNGSYPQRRVIFTDAVAGEGSVNVTASVFNRTLSIGMQGKDVTMLQTLLVEKGLLVIPPGVAKGYFGPLTRTAVANYQAKSGLRADGIFNQATKAKLVPPAPPIAIKPSLPSTSLTPITPTPFTQTVIGSVKSLYETPLDGIITSLLLVAAAFVVFKIIFLRYIG